MGNVSPHAEDPAAAKRALRRVVRSQRGRLSAVALAQAADAIREHVLAAPATRRAQVIAAYAPVGSEPGDPTLLDALAAAGKTVLLPVVGPRGGLTWRAYDGAVAEGRWGLREPTGGPPWPLGVAELVLAPGLAADRAGHRLGRGGGYYDRALTALGDEVPVAVLLHDGELVEQVPHEPHDRLVHAAITPAGGWMPLGSTRRADSCD